METYFWSRNLWDIVDKGIPTFGNIFVLSERKQKPLKESVQKNAAALFILQQAVDDNIFFKISRAQTAKAAWDALKTEFQGNPQSTALPDQQRENCKKYLPLYKAILNGKLESVKKFCHDNENALETRITVNLDTALHVAVGTGKTNDIVKHLLTKVTQLSQKNTEGNTVLSVAAIVGNKEAAQMIMKEDKRRELFTAPNKSGRIPLIEAARHGQKEMVTYLMQFSSRYLTYATSTRFRDDSDVSLVNLLIIAGFYDLALDLLKKYESLATMQLSTGESLLSAIAGKPSAFPSGKRREPKFWGYVDIDDPPSHLKEIQETKSTHRIVLDLVRRLCEKITEDPDDYERVSSILKRPLLLAAELGVCEVVEEIINAFPDAIWFTNEKNHNVFHLAVMNRREKVLQLIYDLRGRKHLLLLSEDVDKNNILHLAGKLAPKNQLNLIPSAALQMQRELQWFKEVEGMVQPDYKEEKNYNGETPGMVFTEEHKVLVKEGEKWMKDAATSCSVAAALVATVVFAAAITVPGDYNGKGQPIFQRLPPFTVFGISDAFSLFSSVAAIIMFLSVLTARYAEDDFYHSLPNRLILGLVMLFLSLTSLMVAFCSTIYLVFCEQREQWVLILVFASALLPISLFVYSQYPLLRDVFNSTYRPGIFGKQSIDEEKKCDRAREPNTVVEVEVVTG
ncbi:ankyrin repeat-containing protein At5g02620-like isoform X2 [Pistacia vera]|uniref:ankyrin repeat-containing protein At5g02620-like isoform X2 n=1 Tax=Pistacia vera TaxID=55513 RepID=UPI001262EF72|nr:ankyrin repeat-containing protein At5g02620-like isoform X2 [Pistacia vera]